jgi:hypothetical protein
VTSLMLGSDRCDTLRPMSKRRVAAVVLSLAAMGALAGCVAGPTAATIPPPVTSAPPTTPAPAPAPEPEPVAASVAISAEAITVLDDAGATLASFDYFQPGDVVVEALDGYLGASIESPYPGGLEQPPGTQHDWGGLRMIDSEAPVVDPYYPEYWVIVTTDEANGLPLGTAPGIGSPRGVRVGESFTSVTSREETFVDTLDSQAGRPISYGRAGLVPLPAGGEYGESPSVGVTIVGYTDENIIDRFIAPSRNWGA